jgi:ATP-binding cassette subfamily B protein
MPGPGGHGRRARIEKARDARGAARRLIRYLQPYKGILLVVFALATGGTILALLGPFLMGLAIDRFIAVGDIHGLLRVALLILGVYLGSWLLQIGQNTLMARASQRAMRDLRRNLFSHLQILSLRFFDRYPHGELMSRLTNDMDNISRVLSQNVTQLFTGVLTLVGILAMMFSLNPRLASGSMLVFPLMFGLVAFVGKRTRKGYRSLQMQIGQLNGELEEMYSGQRVVAAFGQEEATLKRFDTANEAVRRIGIHAQTYAMLMPPLLGILSNANIAVVAGLGGWMSLEGMASVGTIAAFIAYSRRFARPLRQLGDLYNQIQAALAGAERIFEIIDTPPELTDAPNAISLDEVAGEVVFDHVDFAYVPSVPVLRDISLNANPGEMVALVGPTGAGKTTVANLLTRFYDIDNGVIRIDGEDIRHVRKESLRRQLGIVLQETFLFTESVMENIRYGRLDATDAEVMAAARLAGADPFIRRLPQGYETKLSERGSNLSEGQRQLLSIARAVLARPRVLILDEATSSVDTRTEMQIQRALLELMKGRTSFVIAHRLSTIRSADQVLVIDDGRIIECGTHEELLEKRGFYHRLYTSQFRGETAAATT